MSQTVLRGRSGGAALISSSWGLQSIWGKSYRCASAAAATATATKATQSSGRRYLGGNKKRVLPSKSKTIDTPSSSSFPSSNSSSSISQGPSTRISPKKEGSVQWIVDKKHASKKVIIPSSRDSITLPRTVPPQALEVFKPLLPAGVTESGLMPHADLARDLGITPYINPSLPGRPENLNNLLGLLKE